ncbi:hypothetical protein M9Y10_038073 [Tritrichomonas musculus]|uniref:Rab-GAP TBC domain-containing protein n=1 Tax=Tritrichomonas musculus TaxID=1915356 RepID=A0ABR2K7Z7_9EUKA
MNLDELIQKARVTQNFTDLRKYSVYGYGTNKQRRSVWRLLLNLPKSYNPTIIDTSITKEAVGKEVQVKADVLRTFSSIPSPEFKDHKRNQLYRVLLTVLERNPQLSYTQGFHDIASVVLTFAREPLAVLILEALSLGHLKPFLREDLSGLASALNFVFPLLKLIDSELHDFIDSNDLDSSFATSYLLTFFTHNALTLNDGLRYLDFFISSHPLMTVYSVVTLVFMKKSSLMIPEADPGTLMNGFHDLLVDTNVDEIIQKSVELFERYPPSFILKNDKSIRISKNCTFLAPNVEFPYSFPDFPFVDRFPKDLYDKRLNESTSNNLIKGILSALAIAAAIGMRIALM